MRIGAPVMLPGDRGNPLRVAVVGAGPSGFYACEALLRSQLDVAVDLYEKLPAPYGLVRYGVAPDHAHLKSVTRVFERIAATPGLRFHGNVNVGRDVTLDELTDCYHAVILATGVEQEKGLDIPGEELPGSHSARSFVAWYNGHPDYRDCVFDFSNEAAVIVGQGMVDFTDWERIDRAEVARGQPLGKLREKFTSVEEMLRAAAVSKTPVTSIL